MRVFRAACMALFGAVAPLAALAAVAPAQSAADPPVAGHVTTLPEVTVSGVQPGPGLWKISKGDHVLWVLGTLSPLPKKMQWQAREVQQKLADAQQVLNAPVILMQADDGIFGKRALVYAMVGVRNNPNGRRLQDLVPAAEYARWLTLKAKYIGHDNRVERQRPIFAAITLYTAAIGRADLADKVIGPVIAHALKRRGLKSTPVALAIDVGNPHALVRDFRREPIADLDCFDKTLDHLEGDVGLMRARANAWATGDLDRLRGLPKSDEMDICVAAITESGLARKLGVVNLDQKIEATWLAAAGRALDANRTTFALLPIAELLKPDGYLAALKAEGYRVEPPE
jgi:hypothetical protein